MPNDHYLAETERNSIQTRVMRVIAATQSLPAESVTVEKTFADLKIDSFAGINIVFELENEFEIVIPDEGAQAMRSVGDAIAGVHQLLDEKRSLSA
jgi:acyl carrier protein